MEGKQGLYAQSYESILTHSSNPKTPHSKWMVHCGIEENPGEGLSKGLNEPS